MFILNRSFDTANFVDINTLYFISPTEDWIKTELEIWNIILFTWFRENHMKSTTGKCHLLMISRSPVRINIEGHAINKSTEK